jgi:hypothetical protein
MDKTFGRAGSLVVPQFATLMKEGGIEARDNNGVIYPEKLYPTIASMASVPYELDSAYMPWSRPGKYALWTDTELLAEGFGRAVTAHTDAPRVTLTFPDGARLTKEVREGTAVFLLSDSQVKPGRYALEAAGGEKAPRTVYFQGMTLSDALRHGLNLESGSPDGMGVGFTSRLAGREAIEVFLTAGNKTTRLETGVVDGQPPVYLEAYGVSLKQRQIPRGAVRADS